jgi:hypothetical protein
MRDSLWNFKELGSGGPLDMSGQLYQPKSIDLNGAANSSPSPKEIERPAEA